MLPREKAKAIRAAVKSAGYNYMHSFNDKRKDGTHRMKLMQNGYDHGRAQYREWETKINAELAKQGVEVISSGFQYLERYGYGMYGAYIATFK